MKILEKYDVAVCGGGPAGFIAAIAAARNGARTALIERQAFLGGTAAGGLVTLISEYNKNGRRIVGGIPWEFAERLGEENAAELDYPIGNVPFDPEVYKLTAQKMLIESGVDLYLGCTLYDCQVTEGKVESIRFTSRAGNYTLPAEYFIDCTGDAELAVRAGAPLQPMPEEEQLQPATLAFLLAGVDTDKLGAIRFSEHNTKYANARIRAALEQWKEEGEEVPLFGGPWFHYALHEGVVFVNITRSQVWPDDILKASVMECKLREDAHTFVKLLKKHLPEFKNAYISQAGVQAGYRESRRIQGVHTLTTEEFLNHQVFEDTIALSAHPVDQHQASSTKQHVVFLEQEGCIPYRSMILKDFPNLLAGGRCISVDRGAFASIRVQAPVMAIGQAAGTAAALCAKTGTAVNVLDGAYLRKVLAEQGAVVE